MFTKKTGKMIPEMIGIDEKVDDALLLFKTSMTRFVAGVSSREKADIYVRDCAADILSDMHSASLAFSKVVIDLKKRKNAIESASCEPYISGKKEAISKLDADIRLLEESYDQVFQIVDPDSPRSTSHYYTQSEVANLKLCEHTAVLKPFDLPEKLCQRLDESCVNAYLPDAELVKRLSQNSPKVSAADVLKGICLGDYISQQHGTAVYDENMYDIHKNKFTGSSVLAMAVYDAICAVKNMSGRTVLAHGIVPQAYDLFEISMKYYAKLLPDMGYCSDFYMWAICNSKKPQSFASESAVFYGLIGAAFNNIEDVIRYTITASFHTNVGKTDEAGAVITAVCVWLAVHGCAKHDIREYVMSMTEDVILIPDDIMHSPEKIFDLSLSPDELKEIISDDTVIPTPSSIRTLSEALIAFFASANVKTCITSAVTYSRDVNSVSAISCGVSAAYYGSIPYMDDILEHRHDEGIPYETGFVMKRLAEM